jgi:hypothetical protein
LQALSDLPCTVSREIFATLRGLLPPPATNTPEARAVRIRAERELPKRPDFGPPEPAIVDAITTAPARSCGRSISADTLKRRRDCMQSLFKHSLRLSPHATRSHPLTP